MPAPRSFRIRRAPATRQIAWFVGVVVAPRSLSSWNRSRAFRTAVATRRSPGSRTRRPVEPEDLERRRAAASGTGSPGPAPGPKCLRSRIAISPCPRRRVPKSASPASTPIRSKKERVAAGRAHLAACPNHVGGARTRRELAPSCGCCAHHRTRAPTPARRPRFRSSSARTRGGGRRRLPVDLPQRCHRATGRIPPGRPRKGPLSRADGSPAPPLFRYAALPTPKACELAVRPNLPAAPAAGWRRCRAAMRNDRLRSRTSRRAVLTALWLLTSVTTTTSSDRATSARRLAADAEPEITPVCSSSSCPRAAATPCNRLAVRSIPPTIPIRMCLVYETHVLSSSTKGKSGGLRSRRPPVVQRRFSLLASSPAPDRDVGAHRLEPVSRV